MTERKEGVQPFEKKEEKKEEEKEEKYCRVDVAAIVGCSHLR